MRRIPPLLVALVLGVLALLTAGPAHAGSTERPPLEPFASYQPATHCRPHARPGTVELGHWLVRRYGGGFGPIGRACGAGGATSEHNEGRAFDWTNAATTTRGRRTARAFLHDAFATPASGPDAGEPAALARRMGIMYVIWDDHIYSAWNGFAPEPYLNSACRTLKHCSPTLRHRDHVHVSLTRAAARGETSWFTMRAAG